MPRTPLHQHAALPAPPWKCWTSTHLARLPRSRVSKFLITYSLFVHLATIKEDEDLFRVKRQLAVKVWRRDTLHGPRTVPSFPGAWCLVPPSPWTQCEKRYPGQRRRHALASIQREAFHGEAAAGTPGPPRRAEGRGSQGRGRMCVFCAAFRAGVQGTVVVVAWGVLVVVTSGVTVFVV